jgi:GT2 family glycosyltransferase
VASPTFTVVLPAYNSQRTIETTINSVLRQTRSDLELLVVDDGSGDQTPALVRTYADADPRVQMIEQPNAGVAAARNTGISNSRGRYVSLIDHDDAWLPRYLELVGERLEEFTDAGLAYADCWTFRDTDKRVFRTTTLASFPPVAPAESPERFLAALIRANFLTASSVTIAREALDRVGGFRPTAAPSDDWDLWMRITAAGFRGVLAGATPLVLLRESATSQSKDARTMARSACTALERTAALLPEGSPNHALALDRLAQARAALAQVERPSAVRVAGERIRGALRPLKRALLGRRVWRAPDEAARGALQELGEI